MLTDERLEAMRARAAETLKVETNYRPSIWRIEARAHAEHVLALAAELARLRAALAPAWAAEEGSTKGPWEVRDGGHDRMHITATPPPDMYYLIARVLHTEFVAGIEQREANAAFIAAAVNAVRAARGGMALLGEGEQDAPRS